MNDPRSPDTSGSDAEGGWPDSDGSGGREPPEPRGFLGRILGRLGGAGADSDDVPASMMEAAVAGTAPSILNLRRKSVDDVAVTRADIVAVPVDVTLPDLVEVFREHGYSRVPVYRGDLDQPLGLVLFKDLAMKHGFAAKGAPPRFALRPLLRPLLFTANPYLVSEIALLQVVWALLYLAIPGSVIGFTAYLLLVAAIFVVINLVVDVLYTIVDPRLRLSTGRAS